MKNLIWLDDHFISMEPNLEKHTVIVEKSCSIERMGKISLFSAKLLEKPAHHFHGAILDVMLPKENGVGDLGHLNRPDILIKPDEVGLQVAEVLLGRCVEPEDNEFERLFLTMPILILTNEKDYITEYYKSAYPNLFTPDNNVSIVIHSKGEAGIDKTLANWCGQLSNRPNKH